MGGKRVVHAYVYIGGGEDWGDLEKDMQERHMWHNKPMRVCIIILITQG